MICGFWGSLIERNDYIRLFMLKNLIVKLIAIICVALPFAGCAVINADVYGMTHQNEQVFKWHYPNLLPTKISQESLDVVKNNTGRYHVVKAWSDKSYHFDRVELFIENQRPTLKLSSSQREKSFTVLQTNECSSAKSGKGFFCESHVTHYKPKFIWSVIEPDSMITDWDSKSLFSSDYKKVRAEGSVLLHYYPFNDEPAWVFVLARSLD